MGGELSFVTFGAKSAVMARDMNTAAINVAKSHSDDEPASAAFLTGISLVPAHLSARSPLFVTLPPPLSSSLSLYPSFFNTSRPASHLTASSPTQYLSSV